MGDTDDHSENDPRPVRLVRRPTYLDDFITDVSGFLDEEDTLEHYEDVDGDNGSDTPATNVTGEDDQIFTDTVPVTTENLSASENGPILRRSSRTKTPKAPDDQKV